MEQDLFSNLPQEIMFEILSRLRIVSIVRCKCVCKAWLDLIRTREFAKSHSSKSVLALSQFGTCSKPRQILELIHTQNPEGHILFSFKFSFGFPHTPKVLHGSANGLLLFVYFENIGESKFICNPFICNPITREYIRLPSPVKTPSSQHTKLRHIAFGFGVSNVSGEYKVIAAVSEYDPLTRSVGYKFEVYTLGTRSWRRIGASVPPWRDNCVFLKGRLHWLVSEGNSIECFDLETECFSAFSAPEFLGDGCRRRRRLYGLGDNGLCLCDDNPAADDDDVIVWMMKEYGDDKSWTKGFLIKKPLGFYGVIEPIKIFKDGDMMIAIHDFITKLYHYSTKTKTFREIDLSYLSPKFGSIPTIYTPSFFPLKTLSEENVSLF